MFILSFLMPTAGLACELALVLAVDVSGSVDRREFRIQMDGLAAGLRDGIVTDALIDQQAHLTLVQWSGSTRQEQTLPWVRITNAQDVYALAAAIETDERRWSNFSTAIGEALHISMEAFDQAPDCRRRVIDVSGDGISNEGIPPANMRAELAERDITVNALVIETDETDLTGYFYENVIGGERAFVITADGFEDYPTQIRRKLQRETTRQVSQLRLDLE